jgi:hypothetical protein
MAKSTVAYWNALDPANNDKWEVIDDTDGLVEQLTLALDSETGDYTRLTRFKPGADTKSFGTKQHSYAEEIMVLSGRLYDAAFDMWLETGYFTSRPPGELHGPFKSIDGCVVLEISCPGQSIDKPA